jgi:hypothetical protein
VNVDSPEGRPDEASGLRKYREEHERELVGGGSQLMNDGVHERLGVSEQH